VTGPPPRPRPGWTDPLADEPAAWAAHPPTYTVRPGGKRKNYDDRRLAALGADGFPRPHQVRAIEHGRELVTDSYLAGALLCAVNGSLDKIDSLAAEGIPSLRPAPQAERGGGSGLSD